MSAGFWTSETSCSVARSRCPGLMLPAHQCWFTGPTSHTQEGVHLRPSPANAHLTCLGLQSVQTDVSQGGSEEYQSHLSRYVVWSRDEDGCLDWSADD